MAIYVYQCNEHGNKEIVQSMDEPHIAFCPVCNQEMQRIYTPIRIKQKMKMGKDRSELFSNLAKEGFAHPDYEAHDSYLHAARGETVNTESI